KKQENRTDQRPPPAESVQPPLSFTRRYRTFPLSCVCESPHGAAFPPNTGPAGDSTPAECAPRSPHRSPRPAAAPAGHIPRRRTGRYTTGRPRTAAPRSEEHTSELQSRENLVCRLLLEK